MEKKGIALLVCLVILAIGGFICLERFERSRRSPAQTAQGLADLTVAKIRYIRDRDTGLCFAYAEREDHGGGRWVVMEGLANVPCFSVPAALLQTGRRH